MTQQYLPGNIQIRIDELLYENQMSQDRLAQQLGISASKLSRFLRRETASLEPELIVEMAKIFHVSTDFLLGMTNDRIPIDYELLNLNLSGSAVRKLITGEVDANVVSQMIEHDLAGVVTQRVREIQDYEVREGINAIAKLSEQILTSALVDDPYRAETDPEIIRMKQEAKYSLMTREDQYTRQQTVNEMAHTLFGNICCTEPYYVTREEQWTRSMLSDRISAAQARFSASFTKSYRVEPLFRLWVQLCRVLHAPKRIQALLDQALYEAFEKEKKT